MQIQKHLGGLLGLPDDAERSHIHPSVKVAPKSQVAPDCIVGESVTIGERCSVKRSVIGKHCVIADGVHASFALMFAPISLLPGENHDQHHHGPRHNRRGLVYSSIPS